MHAYNMPPVINFIIYILHVKGYIITITTNKKPLKALKKKFFRQGCHFVWYLIAK